MPKRKTKTKKTTTKRTGQKQRQHTNIRINIGGDGKVSNSKSQPSAHTVVTQSAPPQYIQNYPSSLTGIGELNKAISRLNTLVPNYVGLGNVPPRYSRDSQTELELAGRGYIQNDMFSRGGYNNAHRDVRFHNDLQDNAMSDITDYSVNVRTPAMVAPFDENTYLMESSVETQPIPKQDLFGSSSSSTSELSFIPIKNELTEQQKKAIGESVQKKQTILDIMNEPESQPQVGQHDMMVSRPEESKQQSKKIRMVGFMPNKDPHIYDDLLDPKNDTQYSLPAMKKLATYHNLIDKDDLHYYDYDADVLRQEIKDRLAQMD